MSNLYNQSKCLSLNDTTHENYAVGNESVEKEAVLTTFMVRSWILNVRS
jgi:hypothetical protein